MIIEANDEALFLVGFNNDKQAFDIALIGVTERAGGVIVTSYAHA